ETPIPTSLVDLRRTLMARGVPNRDIAIKGGALDLTGEPGLLAASEQFIFKARAARNNTRRSSAPFFVGQGHSVHPSARIVGPVVIHAGARIEEGAAILGPALIGPGARIGAGAIVAHATIGPDSIVQGGRTGCYGSSFGSRR